MGLIIKNGIMYTTGVEEILYMSILKVEELPTTNIKEFPYIYALLSDDNSSYYLYEYRNNKWYPYKATSTDITSDEAIVLDGKITTLDGKVVLVNDDIVALENQITMLNTAISQLETKASQVSNPNLIINSNFNINQREGKIIPKGSPYYNTKDNSVEAGGYLDKNYKLDNIEGDWTKLPFNIDGGWSSVSTLPYGFSGGCALLDSNGYINILGGIERKGAHYKYNGSSWSSVSTLSYDFYYGSALLDNDGNITAIGPDKSHYKYNGSSWIIISILPYDFYDGSALLDNNGYINILGSRNNSSYFKYHYKYNGSSWSGVSTLPYDFYDGGALLDSDGYINILGTGSGSSYNKYHYIYNGSSWSSVSTLPYEFVYGSTLLDNNGYINILGSNSSYYKYHYKYNGSSWSNVSTLPYDFYNGNAVLDSNGYINILGTGSGSSYFTNHYKFQDNILYYAHLGNTKEGYIDNNTYSFDRWYLTNNDTTSNTCLSRLNASTNTGVHFFSNSKTDCISYLFEENLKGASYTLSIKTKDQTGEWNIFAFDADTYKLIGTLSANSINTFNIADFSTKKISIIPTTDGGASIELEWIKLEEGDLSTPYKIPMYNEEIVKCERYFARIYKCAGICIRDTNVIEFDHNQANNLRKVLTIYLFNSEGLTLCVGSYDNVINGFVFQASGWTSIIATKTGHGYTNCNNMYLNAGNNVVGIDAEVYD